MKKDEKKIWFRNKSYGWGWYPVTWEGWIVTLAFVGVIVLWATQIRNAIPNQWTWYWLGMVGAIGALLAICIRFGEKPEWRWEGKPMFRRKR